MPEKKKRAAPVKPVTNEVNTSLYLKSTHNLIMWLVVEPVVQQDGMILSRIWSLPVPNHPWIIPECIHSWPPCPEFRIYVWNVFSHLSHNLYTDWIGDKRNSQIRNIQQDWKRCMYSNFYVKRKSSSKASSHFLKTLFLMYSRNL